MILSILGRTWPSPKLAAAIIACEAARPDCTHCRGTGHDPRKHSDLDCPECGGSGHEYVSPPSVLMPIVRAALDPRWIAAATREHESRPTVRCEDAEILVSRVA